MISTKHVYLGRLGIALALALGLAGAGCKKKEQPAATGSGSGTGTGSGTAAVAAVDAPPAPVNLITKAATPQEAVDAADRSAEDKALDAGRKPVELLTLLGVAEGQKVAELFAGGGYTVELLARVVGPTGTVYGQNTKKILEMFAEKPWAARLAHLASPTIVRVDRELAEPLPPEATNLDLVVMHLVYHDAVAMGVDRAAMNLAIWKALKDGGHFAIIDHSAKDGSGPNNAADLHRIEAAFVQSEVEQTGFILETKSDLFAHAEDTRDWSTSPMAAADKRGTSDRFVLYFKKPVIIK